MTTERALLDMLGAFAKGAAPDMSLAHAAVMIGALDRPGLPVDRYVRHLEKLATKVGDYARLKDGPVPVAVRIEALRQVLSRHYGYGGGETDGMDEDCSEMSRVIDSRAGSSEALAILYADVARRLDWAIDVVHVPGRMLVRLDAFGDRMIVDPLGDGRTLEPEDLRAIVKAFGGNHAELPPNGIRPLTDTEALLRLMAARKNVLLRSKRLEDAARLIERALVLAPEEPTLWRECGLINARLERIQAAVDALEEYLRLGAGDAARYNTTMLLQELRGRLT